ncbi:MAG TPA: AraD1 family protein [Bryocella sp.]|nr:AraD1 family protein [Bryocella sp.]
MRLVQISSGSGKMRVAVVDSDHLQLLNGCNSVYDLAQTALRNGKPLCELAKERISDEKLEYGPIYRCESEWRLLPPFTHPEPARCLVTGTGLTHKASADNRQAMHHNPAELSDSMRMYLAGLEGGHPEPGRIGSSPEWFYKGCGTILRAHGEPLVVPPFAGDGGEEPEIAGIYVIDSEGRPRRIGMAMTNEFSDHILERQNYLYLAHSKLRTCSIGPELVLDPEFDAVPGTVSIERDGATLWSHLIATGERNMSHTLGNLEHHHFKYDAHRRPGDAHIYFFGADAFSFGAGVELQDGDIMVIAFEGFGRPLRNSIRVEKAAEKLVEVLPL